MVAPFCCVGLYDLIGGPRRKPVPPSDIYKISIRDGLFFGGWPVFCPEGLFFLFFCCFAGFLGSQGGCVFLLSRRPAHDFGSVLHEVRASSHEAMVENGGVFSTCRAVGAGFSPDIGVFFPVSAVFCGKPLRLFPHVLGGPALYVPNSDALSCRSFGNFVLLRFPFFV